MENQPSSSTTSTQDNKSSPNLLDLPFEMIELILDNVAKLDYCSLEVLARTSRKMRSLCQSFMQRNPRTKYSKVTYCPAGMSDSEDDDEWNYDRYDGNHGDDMDENELDELNERLERFSYGSNYDEDIDEFLNGPSQDDDQPPEADESGGPIAANEQIPDDDSGW